MYPKGYTTYKLGEIFDCSPETVRRILKDFNVKIRRRGYAAKNLDPTPEEVISLYKKGLSISEVALILNITRHPVQRILKNASVSRRRNQKIIIPKDDRLLIESLWISGDYLVKEIVEETEYSSWCVGKLLKDLGYNTQPRVTNKQYRYYDKVKMITNESWKEYYDNINPLRLPRSRFEYHLDHIYPVFRGFENNISPEKIGHWTNLQMLWWKDNLKKGRKILVGDS